MPGNFELVRIVTFECRPGSCGNALLSELGRGGGGIVVGRSRERSDGGGSPAVLAPNEERLVEKGFGAPGPVDRFKPRPAVDECA